MIAIWYNPVEVHIRGPLNFPEVFTIKRPSNFKYLNTLL